MKISKISPQVNNSERLNIYVDQKYSFSLTIDQLLELGLKVGTEISTEQLQSLKQESQFSKLYARTLDFCLLRPRSQYEVETYLYKKTLPRLVRSLKTGKTKSAERVSPIITKRVLAKLLDKKYLDDQKFAHFWVESRFLKKGISRRRLRAELAQKRIAPAIIEQVLAQTERQDQAELAKVIAKKAARYHDKNKLMQYLVRQGFSYDDVKTALENVN